MSGETSSAAAPTAQPQYDEETPTIAMLAFGGTFAVGIVAVLIMTVVYHILMTRAIKEMESRHGDNAEIKVNAMFHIKFTQ